MVAADEGSVFYGQLTVNSNNKFSDVWIQLYEQESFEHTFGSALAMRGNNVPVTIVLNSTFVNCFSEEGAAILIAEGGALFYKYCSLF